MKTNPFFKYLTIISLLTILGLVASAQFEPLKEHQLILWIALLFFIVLSVVLYYLSKKAAVHKNPMLFMYVMVFAILIKFGFCLIALFAYNRFVQPENKLFVLPFIVIYVIYTTFETYFMFKLGKLKPANGT